MANNCFKCQIDLNKQDCFDWEGKQVCRTCLEVLKIKEQRPTTRTQSQTDKKKQTLTFNSMTNNIRIWSIGLIIFGILQLLTVSSLRPSWSLIIIILGVTNLFLPQLKLHLTNAIFLIIVGAIGIVRSVRAGGDVWIVVGILVVIWGRFGIQQFSRFKNVNKTEGKLVYEQLPKNLSTIRDFKFLINRKQFGVNVHLGVGHLLSMIMYKEIVRALYAVVKGYSFSTGSDIFPFIFHILLAIGLVTVNYFFYKNPKSIILVYTGFNILLSFLLVLSEHLYLIQNSIKSPFEFGKIISLSLIGFLFIYSLIKIINKFGLQWKALVLGFLCIGLLQFFLVITIYFIFHGIFLFDLFNLLMSLLNGMILGLLIYFGFTMHLQMRTSKY